MAEISHQNPYEKGFIGTYVRGLNTVVNGPELIKVGLLNRGFERPDLLPQGNWQIAVLRLLDQEGQVTTSPSVVLVRTGRKEYADFIVTGTEEYGYRATPQGMLEGDAYYPISQDQRCITTQLTYDGPLGASDAVRNEINSLNPQDARYLTGVLDALGSAAQKVA